jgi:hypothetical protein
MAMKKGHKMASKMAAKPGKMSEKKSRTSETPQMMSAARYEKGSKNRTKSG